MTDMETPEERSELKDAGKTDAEERPAEKLGKILIVDDDMRNIFSLNSLLEDRDLKVLFAHDGKEGWKY